MISISDEKIIITPTDQSPEEYLENLKDAIKHSLKFQMMHAPSDENPDPHGLNAYLLDFLTEEVKEETSIYCKEAEPLKKAIEHHDQLLAVRGSGKYETQANEIVNEAIIFEQNPEKILRSILAHFKTATGTTLQLRSELIEDSNWIKVAISLGENELFTYESGDRFEQACAGIISVLHFNSLNRAVDDIEENEYHSINEDSEILYHLKRELVTPELNMRIPTLCVVRKPKSWWLKNKIVTSLNDIEPVSN